MSSNWRTRFGIAGRGSGAANPYFSTASVARAAIIHGIWGLALGALVLHPLAMAICGWFRLCGQTNPPESLPGLISVAFGPGAVHGAFAFAVFGLAIGMIEGYGTAIIRLQRDSLARQLQFNRAYRYELESQNTALRELEQTKRRTTRFLVHDLKNHIGCVLGYTNLLLKRARTNGWQQRDQDALMTVRRQAARMEGAVRDVLELAKLERQPRLELRRLPAVNVLREATTASAIGPEDGTVAVDAEVPSELTVDCDPALIVRVMINLVGNAVKHNGDDVIVTLGAHDGPKSVIFTCTDTGRGVPEGIRDRLFDEFTSSHRKEHTTPSYGLGLAFCRAAVEAHGGRIWFETQNGVGTSFLFSLPKREGNEGLDVGGTPARHMWHRRPAA